MFAEWTGLSRAVFAESCGEILDSVQVLGWCTWFASIGRQLIRRFFWRPQLILWELRRVLVQLKSVLRKDKTLVEIRPCGAIVW